MPGKQNVKFSLREQAMLKTIITITVILSCLISYAGKSYRLATFAEIDKGHFLVLK